MHEHITHNRHYPTFTEFVDADHRAHDHSKNDGAGLKAVALQK